MQPFSLLRQTKNAIKIIGAYRDMQIYLIKIYFFYTYFIYEKIYIGL